MAGDDPVLDQYHGRDFVNENIGCRHGKQRTWRRNRITLYQGDLIGQRGDLDHSREDAFRSPFFGFLTRDAVSSLSPLIVVDLRGRRQT